MLLPLAAVVSARLRRTAARRRSGTRSPSPQAVAALKLTRDRLADRRRDQRGLRHDHRLGPGPRRRSPARALVNALIDLPFALPTIVAGLTLLALYGPTARSGIDVAYTRVGGRRSRCCSSRCPSSSARCSRCCSSWTARWRRRRPRSGARAVDDLPPHHPPQPAARRSSPASRSPSPARSASSARSS